MQFLLSCLFYSFIGSAAGFLVHIFNGIIQTHIVFNKAYIQKTVSNFCNVLIVMFLVTAVIAGLILIVPTSFLEFIGTDTTFFHQLIFYLFTFAAFDFGIKNEK